MQGAVVYAAQYLIQVFPGPLLPGGARARTPFLLTGWGNATLNSLRLAVTTACK